MLATSGLSACLSLRDRRLACCLAPAQHFPQPRPPWPSVATHLGCLSWVCQALLTLVFLGTGAPLESDLSSLRPPWKLPQGPRRQPWYLGPTHTNSMLRPLNQTCSWVPTHSSIWSASHHIQASEHWVSYPQVLHQRTRSVSSCHALPCPVPGTHPFVTPTIVTGGQRRH